MYIINNDVFDNEIYNVLTINATVSEIVETIRKFKSELEVSYVDSRVMNQLSYTVACEKFKSLGFVFKGNLEQDIKETVGLFQSVYNNKIS